MLGHQIAAAPPVPPAAATDGEGRLPALPVPHFGTATGPEFLAYLAMAAHENSAGHHPDAALYALHSENDDTLHGQDDSHGGLLDGENHQRARANFLRDRAISQRG